MRDASGALSQQIYIKLKKLLLKLKTFSQNVKTIKNYLFTKYWEGFDNHIKTKIIGWRSISAPNVKKISIFTLLCKVSFWQKFATPKMEKQFFCVAYEYGRLHLRIKMQISLQKHLFWNDCLDSSWSIVMINCTDISSHKFCQIISHRNPAHLLNRSCYPK